jgi:hypothetical protein
MCKAEWALEPMDLERDHNCNENGVSLLLSAWNHSAVLVHSKSIMILAQAPSPVLLGQDTAKAAAPECYKPLRVSVA